MSRSGNRDSRAEGEMALRLYRVVDGAGEGTMGWYHGYLVVVELYLVAGGTLGTRCAYKMKLSCPRDGEVSLSHPHVLILSSYTISTISLPYSQP